MLASQILVNETKYSGADQVNFLKAVFHKIYLVHSQILVNIFGEKVAAGRRRNLFTL